MGAWKFGENGGGMGIIGNYELSEYPWGSVTFR